MVQSREFWYEKASFNPVWLMQHYYPHSQQESTGWSTRKKFIVLIIGFVILFIILGLAKFLQIRSAMSKRPIFPPYKVTTAIAESSAWPDQIDLVGELNPVQGVVLKAEQAGTVRAVNYVAGSNVSKDQILLQIDTSEEAAQLKSAQAKFAQSQLTYNRSVKLKAADAISKVDFEQDQAEYTSAKAEVERLTAVINKKTIRAPFAGKTGIRKINIGDLVSVGQELVPIYNDQELYLDFEVAEAAASQIAPNLNIEFRVDAFADQAFSAKVNAVNPQVNSTDRMLSVQAIVDNSNSKLRSGMSAKIRLLLGTPQNVVVIPASSIAFAPYGDSVYVVKKMKDETERSYQGVEQRFVKLGVYRGDLVAVNSGLKAGDVVVTSGAFKLRPAQEVEIDNAIMPDSKLNPTPEDS